MPVTCWKTARATAMRSGRRNAGRKISRNDPSSRLSASLISRIAPAAASAVSARVRTVRASSSRPFLTSQRGLSGTRRSSRKKTIEGTAPMAYIQRQFDGPAPAKSQLTK